MNEMMLANLPIGGVFLYAKGGGKDTHIENTYWIKVAECFSDYGKYIGCRCCEILMGYGTILDEEMLPTDLMVVLNEEDKTNGND